MAKIEICPTCNEANHYTEDHICTEKAKQRKCVLQELTIRINSIPPNEDRTAMIHAIDKIESLQADLQSRLNYSKNQMAQYTALYNVNTGLQLKIDKALAVLKETLT